MMLAWTRMVAMTRIEIYFGYTATKRNEGLHKMKTGIKCASPPWDLSDKVNKIPLQRNFCCFLIPVYSFVFHF